MKLCIKIGFFSVLFLWMAVPAYSDHNDESRFAASEADLEQEIKWLQAEAYVFTASKKTERLNLAPSVMTVYTDEDIRREGFRNLNELLERTTGFFINRNMSNVLISNRGISLNENEPFLLLIDGHSMNSIVDKGAGDFLIFPLISYAKQIEIIRGPGSTLWGSDAALGVINIITKDGGDINGFETSVDYASEDGYRYANVLYGNSQDDENDVMLSFTYAASDGFPEDGYTSNEIFDPEKQRGPIDKINDSWEFYGKIHQKEFTFTARASDLMNLNMDKTLYWDENKPEVHDYSDFNDYYNRRRHYYLDMKHVKTFNTSYTLETKVFADLMECWQGMANPNISSGLQYVDEYFSSKESRLGMEMMLQIDYFKHHHLLTGVQGLRTEVDPVFFRVAQALFVEDPPSVYKEVTLMVKPDDEDLNLAAYIEDNWTLTDDLNVILGLRIDHNTLREDSTKILPRAAVIYQFATGWTAKYLFNTGYVRPPVAKSFLAQAPELPDTLGFYYPHIGVEESEEVVTHDLQLSYHHPRLSASVTGYHTIFKNAFNFAGTTGEMDDVLYFIFYANSNEITSNGIEFDARLNINRFADIYGNYSHVISSKVDQFENTVDGIAYSMENIHLFTDNRTLTGFPHILWNLGLDVFLLERITLNLHYRGWTDMSFENETAPGSYEKLGPEHFVDANLRLTDLPANITVALYVKNLFDNQTTYPLLFTDGWPVRTRSVGAKVSIAF